MMVAFSYPAFLDLKLKLRRPAGGKGAKDGPGSSLRRPEAGCRGLEGKSRKAQNRTNEKALALTPNCLCYKELWKESQDLARNSLRLQRYAYSITILCYRNQSNFIAERMGYFCNGIKSRASFCRKGLIETGTGNPGGFCRFGHSFPGPGDFCKSDWNKSGVFIVKRNLDKCLNFLFVFEMVKNIKLCEFHLISFAIFLAVFISACWLDLSPPQSRTINFVPTFTKYSLKPAPFLILTS